MGFICLKATEPLRGDTLLKVPLKVPYWLNVMETGGKYCKRYTLPELKKVKIRNSKFELLVGKFFSLHYFANAILREVFFWYLERVFQH